MALVLAAVVVAAAPVAGDVLVTRDGGRIDTKGAWQVRGNVVVFQLANGTLSSLRAAEVDLDASRAATEAALRPPPPPPPPPAKQAPIAVITTEDIGRGPAAAKPEEKAAGAEGTARGQVTTDLEVIGWKVEDREAFSGVVLVGSIRNVGKLTMSDLAIEAVLLDEKGKPIQTFSGFVKTRVLFSQAVSAFEVPLPGVTSVVDVELRPRGVAVQIGIAPPPPEGGAAASDTPAAQNGGGGQSGGG